MNPLLSTIILVLSGFIGYTLACYLAPQVNRTVSDFEKTVTGLMFTIPGILWCWVMVSLFDHQAYSFSHFQETVLTLPGFIVYVSTNVAISCIISTLWQEKIVHFVLAKVNEDRKEKKMPSIHPESAWEFFYNGYESKLFGIYPMGQRKDMILGEVERSFKPGDLEKGIVLIGTKTFEGWKEYLPEPERVYIDTNTKMVYEYYSADSYQKAEELIRYTRERENSTSLDEVV